MLLHLILKKLLKQLSLGLLIALLGLFFTQNLTAQNDLWIAKPDMGDGTADKRSGAVSFVINGKIYIGLGQNNSGYLPDLWEYDTISETWTQKADIASSIGRSGAFCMVMNNKAIIGTGENPGGVKTNTVYKYEAGTNTWTPLADFGGGARVYSSAFSIGTKGFVVGGDDGAFQNDLWEYDISGNNWIGRANFPGTARIKAVSFTIGTHGYYGTGDLGAGALGNDMWDYDIVTDSWVQIADFPGSARAGSAGCSNGTLGYLGFGNDGGFLVDFWTFDGTNWTQMMDLPDDPRELAVAAAVGNKVYAGTGFGVTYYRDFYQWDPCAKPQILTQPVGLPELCEGTDGELSVEISNTGGETYEWRRDGVAVPGGTSNILSLTAVTVADHEGNYVCEITNSCGTTTTETVYVNVIPLPIDSPSGVLATPDTLCPDNTFDIILTADNNGITEDTLKWFANACDGDLLGIGFPVNTEIQVTPPTPPASVEYYVRWENQCGATDCDTVFIFAKEESIEPTSIATSQDTICNSYSDSLFLTVEGGSGDFVAWYLGDICANASAPLIDTGIKIDLFTLGQIPTETKTYSARWETYCGGSEFHSTCLLIDVVVNGDFSISQQPQNRSVCEGADTVIFDIGVDPGESIPDIFYQWYFEENAISGAQSDTLMVFDILAVDSGNYYCKVFNSCDTIISDSAFLTVNLNPEIILEPVIYDTICEGDSVSFFLEAEGSPVLTYQWHFNDVPTADLDSAYVINPASFINTGDYYCVVTNGCNSDTSDIVSLEVDTIPFVTLQPEDQIVCLNGTAQFETSANGTNPITYQWYKIDGSGTYDMSGETGTMLEITPVLEADTAFNYFCIASNECSDGISSDTVSLDMHAQIEIMDSITSDTNNVCYTFSNYIKLTVFGGEGDTIRWFEDACEGDTIATTVDTTLNIPVPDSTTTYYARWENACGISACDSITITVAQDAEVMDTLYFEENDICYNAYDSILLTAVGGNGDSIRWFDTYNCNGVPFAVTADTFVYVHNIPLNSATYAAQYINACGESECMTVNLYINDLTFVVDQTLELDVCEGTYTSMFVEPIGTDPFYFQWYFNGSQLAGETNDTLYRGPISFADTGMYYCQVWSECDTTISDSIPLMMKELPYYVQQPLDKSVCEGSRDTIQISIAGDEPIIVQWYKNGLEFGGSQVYDTLLIIDPVYETAEYSARISNGCGILYSDTITHRAYDTLVILDQPDYQNKCLFETAEFMVHVEHTEFVEYAWYKLNNPTPVGNDSLLVLPNLIYDDEGEYFCIISDTCGEISSDTALLNMNQIPSFDSDPFGQTVCEGSYFEFQVTLPEFLDPIADSIEFRWNHDGAWEPDSDGLVFAFDPVARGDEGEYYIEAANNCGTINSQPAILNVNYLPDPLQSVSVNPDTVCPQNNFDFVSLTAVGNGGGYGDVIEWYEGAVGNANIIGTGNTINVAVPTITTEYFARWVNECTDNDGTGGSVPGGGTHEALSVVVTYQDYPQPPSSLSVDVNNFCITYGDSINLSGQGGYGDILEWYLMPDMNFLGTGTSIRVDQPMDTTVYAARWVNHCGVSDSVTIQVNVVPLPVALVAETDTICAGQPYQIENVFIDHYDSIRWTSSHSTGYFDTATIQYPIYNNDDIELYDTVVQYLYLTAYGKADCEDAYDTIQLISTPLPVLSIDSENPAICRDSLITITASGAETYIWEEMNGSDVMLEENPITISPIETTEYNLIGIDPRGCIDSINFELTVYPTPLVDLGDSVFIFSCEPVQLDAGGGDGSEYYIWSNGYRTRSITVYETGNYSVIVGNPGCEVSDTGYISLCNGRMFMPNAFTPNEDGMNETFKPITADPSVEFHMMIFDRWGQMIFETYDIHEGWDGNLDGEPCPAGNYVWRIDYQGQGTESPGKKGSDVGTVMLVR